MKNDPAHRAIFKIPESDLMGWNCYTIANALRPTLSQIGVQVTPLPGKVGYPCLEILEEMEPADEEALNVTCRILLGETIMGR